MTKNACPIYGEPLTFLQNDSLTRAEALAELYGLVSNSWNVIQQLRGGTITPDAAHGLITDARKRMNELNEILEQDTEYAAGVATG